MKYSLVTICLLMLAVMLPSSSMAAQNQDPVGSVTSVKGEFKIKKKDQTVWVDAQSGLNVFYGDAIKTGKSGQGIITLVDDSFIKVHSDSHIVLNTIISPLEKKSSILLFFGRVWNKVSKKALRKKIFEVQTPTAVCGVRGTDFETGSYEDGTTLVLVNSGEVNIGNDTNQETLTENEGTQLSYESRDIKVERQFKPDWNKGQTEGRRNLFADGEKYGGYVHTDIYKRRDHLKSLVEQASLLSEKKKQLSSQARTAQDQGDDLAHESLLAEIEQINREMGALNKQIAYYGGRLECQFGLFSHYGDLAKRPELSKQFKGRDFILKELDNIDMVRAEFDAMIEEGMKMSMEDMEDLMDEMRNKMKDSVRLPWQCLPWLPG